MLAQSIFVITLLTVADATCMGHLHRRSAENNTVEVSKFGYAGQVGPLLWHTFAEENSACEKGEWQSPINIGRLPSFTYQMCDMKVQSPLQSSHSQSFNSQQITNDLRCYDQTSNIFTKDKHCEDQACRV